MIISERTRDRPRLTRKPMLGRWPRFREAFVSAIHFWELAVILVAFTYLTWILNKLFDTLYQENPGLFPGVPVVGAGSNSMIATLAAYMIGLAVLFWILSRANPTTWENIERMLGWEKEKGKSEGH